MGRRDYEALIFLIIIFIAAIPGNIFLPVLLGSTAYLFFIKPLFWFILSFYVWKKPRCRFEGKLKLYRFILIWSAICGVIYVSIFFSGGFLDGIGASPYTKSIQGIIINVLGFGSVVVMMEWVRNYIINRVKKKYLILFCIITVFVYTLYQSNLRIIPGLKTWQQVVQYMGEYAGPGIVGNILLTYIVLIGGAYPAIIYASLTALPMWIVPILPNLTWITKAFIGIMSPVAFMLVIRQVYKKQTNEIRLREHKREKPQAWIATSIVCICMIWFAVGVFPIFPTVILTGSMQPVIYPGDVAIIKKSDGKDLKTGDVIQYWTGEIFIIHRIIAIDEASGKYQTKGDNNSAPDSALVSAGQVKGKMVAMVPKIGMLSILFKSNDDIPKEKVEF